MPTATATRVMMQAVSFGPAVPQGSWTFSVHSIFRRAVNLGIDGSDLLACLTGPSGQGQPGAVALGVEADFREWPLTPGMAGRFAEGLLTFGADRPVASADCAFARREPAFVMSRICSVGLAFDQAALELRRIQASKGAEFFLSGDSSAHPGATPVVAALHEGLMLLDAATKAIGSSACPEAGDFAPALSRLVGTGPGLTPTGDDLLSGYLAALSAVASPAVPALAGAIEAAAPGTNDISASWLRCSARGFFHGALARLSRCLAAEEAFAAVGALRALCSIGHFSGADMATGFLHGLAIHSGSPSGCKSEQGRLYAS
ncbi:MAG: DUF2877 domain-containing protein [Rectinemataceae bacterium]